MEDFLNLGKNKKVKVKILPSVHNDGKTNREIFYYQKINIKKQNCPIQDLLEKGFECGAITKKTINPKVPIDLIRADGSTQTVLIDSHIYNKAIENRRKIYDPWKVIGGMKIILKDNGTRTNK